MLTAYGIVNVMGPVLVKGESLKDALPCIITLGVYELALLGVLVLIVSRQVIDDAVSVAVLIALFLVGTSMALGSVADKGVSASFYVGLVGVGVAFGKLCVMRHFAGIGFRVASLVGLVGLVGCNYLGPVLLARSIAIDPTREPARRVLWLTVLFSMLVTAGVVVAEAVRAKAGEQGHRTDSVPFLRRPVMVYVFALILVVASGVHQYSMAFIFVLERVLGDFVPLITVGTLLSLEILRHLGKRFGRVEILISCVPLAAVMLAINEKSVLASGEFGMGLICYPPVILGLSGAAIGILALLHRWRWLWLVVFAYGLCVVLTVGFSPQSPYDLNNRACVGTLVAGLLVYGMIIRNPYVCLSGILVLCLGLSQRPVLSKFAVSYALTDDVAEFATSYDLTETGVLAGIFGLGSMGICLLFGKQVHRAVRIVGAVCLAGFVVDYLPEYAHWRYAAALLGTGLLTAGLWWRTRDPVAIGILWVPFFIRLYMLAKRIAHWRFVILGFLVLGAGTFVSLLKRPRSGCEDEPQSVG
ncbi:MAG: hypothetical protein ACYS29_15685 [Planctomycetota bacterium]